MRKSYRGSAFSALILVLLFHGTASAQSGTVMPWPWPQFFTADGLSPCDGCKLYSFQSGTSTPLDTYSDVTLMTANPNPIVMNAAGRPSVNGTEVAVYLSFNSYKFRLDSSADVTIRTQDTVAATHVGQTGTFSTTATGDQDNFDFDSASQIRANNASLLTIRGLSAGVAGQRLTIISIGAGQVDIANQHASATAANRIVAGVTGTISLAPGSGHVVLEYDATTSRWRVIDHEQGAWITPTFDAADYTASTGTWTVDSGDVSSMRYRLTGRTMTVAMVIITSDVSDTPSTLRRAIPGGFTAGSTINFNTRVSDAGATTVVSVGQTTSAGTNILFYSTITAAANWTMTASDNTAVDILASFEVQ